MMPHADAARRAARVRARVRIAIGSTTASASPTVEAPATTATNGVGAAPLEDAAVDAAASLVTAKARARAQGLVEDARRRNTR